MMIFLIAAVFGAFIGSFLNVCIHRLPRNQSVISPPSRCQACGTRLGWQDNLPLVGWLLRWGRCRFCGSRFSAQYLLMELAVATLTGATAWWMMGQAPHVAPVPGGADDAFFWLLHVHPSAAPVLGTAALLVVVWYALVAAIIDLKHEIIPDELTAPMQVMAPFLALVTPFAMRQSGRPLVWFQAPSLFGEPVFRPAAGIAPVSTLVIIALVLLVISIPLARRIYARCPSDEAWTDTDHRAFALGVLWFVGATLAAYLLWLGLAFTLDGTASVGGLLATVHGAQILLGALAGWGGLYLVGLIGTLVLRRNAMGFGDVKFLAPLGAVLGPMGVLYAFLGASLVATAIGVPCYLSGRSPRIRFGPFLALGTVLVLVFGPWLDGVLWA